MADNDVDEKLDEINEMMNMINKRLRKIGKKISYDEDESREKLCGMDLKDLEKIVTCLQGIADSIPKLTSDDPRVFVSGCVDIAAAVTTLIPVYGPLISGVLGVVSSVLIASTETTDIVMVFKEMIEKVLSKYRDEDIKAEAAGTKSELITIQSFLTAFLNKGAHTKDDVTSLNSLQIPTVGTKFLGKLEYYISLYSKNKISVDDQAVEFQARCADDYIEIYLRLSALRQLLLLQYYCSLQSESVRQDFQATAEAVIRTLDIAMRKDKEFVRDLPLVYTTPERAVLASVFNLSEHPTIGTLLGKAATDIDMDSALVQLKPKQSPTHCLSAKLFERNFVHLNRKTRKEEGTHKGCDIIGIDSKDSTVASCFTLNRDGNDNVFHITGDQMYRFGIDEYQNFSGGGKKIWENGTIEDLNSTGNDGRWKLIRLFELNKDPQKQLYLIASVKCPARFLYLAAGGIFTNAQAMVKVGDPGDQGYWYLDADGAEKAKVKPRPARGWFG